MSTKTSIKRIAAVAAVALTLGGFSAVSAHAANAQLVTVDLSSAPATAAVGVPVTAIVHLSGVATENGADLKSLSFIAAEPSTSALTYNTLTATDYTGTAYTKTSSGTFATGADSGNSYYIKGDFTHANTAAGTTLRSNYYYNLAFTPDAAGTYTIVVYSPIDTTQKATWTVTVSAQAFNQAKVYIGATGAEATADAAAASLTASATATATTAVARIDIRQYSTADTTTAMVTNAAASVAISGAGAVDTVANGATRGASASIAAVTGSGGLQTFYVFPDGRSGTATIAVTVNGVVTSTKTFTFSGSLKTYALAATQASTFANYIPKGGTSTLTVGGLDSNGNAVTIASGAINAVSSNTAVATVSATDTSGVITVTGVTAGTANITLTNSTTAATVTLVVPVEVTLTTAKTVTITTDASSYAPGGKITLTVTATDSNGRPVADGARNLFSSTGITSDVAVGSATYTAAAAVTLAKGVATFTAYAPATGSVTFSATQGAAVDAVIAGTTAAAITATTVAVVNAAADAAQAAVDAANEATDAANAATDAANNAMDSADAAQQAALDAGDKADAALAAVTDLASKVADIATQISALSSLVSKIAASVAKISAKVKA